MLPRSYLLHDPLGETLGEIFIAHLGPLAWGKHSQSLA
jgi:hypothetical protein